MLSLGASSSSSSVYWQVSGTTDIGGGVENQDSHFVWEDSSLGVCVACVCDGHGKEVGRYASTVACEVIHRLCKETHNELLANPTSWLINAHTAAHTSVKAEFKRALRATGQVVEETTEGYLVKKKDPNANWSCVHGGTSCSIVVIIGSIMYISNVGDSSAILCAKHPIFAPSQLEHIMDAALPNNSPLQAEKLARNGKTPLEDHLCDHHLLLTAEHSPECLDEFYRFRTFRPKPTNPNEPDMGIVYDAQGTLKSRCPCVFTVDSDGTAAVSNKGK
jgi:serine/threonine protein phosphatase PrpC